MQLPVVKFSSALAGCQPYFMIHFYHTISLIVQRLKWRDRTVISDKIKKGRQQYDIGG